MIERIRLLTDIEIEPHSAANLIITPPINSPFLPAWFSIPDEIARHFLLTNVKIGKNSQLISIGCLPASLFAESMLARIDLDEIGLSSMEHLVPNSTRDTITLSVTNTSDLPQKITADVLGRPIGDRPSNVDFKYALGLGHTTVRGNSSANINVQPPIDFIPSHLFLPNHVLDDLLVTDLYAIHVRDEPSSPRSYVLPVNLQEDQLRLSGRVTLSPRSVVKTNQFLTLSVTNRSPHDRYFTGAVLGSPASS
jgi:hypothetical protein